MVGRLDETLDAIAAGIYRGEGTIVCVVTKRGQSLQPNLHAKVEMCDRDSVELVARSWCSNVKQTGRPRCMGGLHEYRTDVQGVNRVKSAIMPWMARGWLGREKTEQYFDAVAKCRRARRVFQEKEQRGRRQSF